MRIISEGISNKYLHHVLENKKRLCVHYSWPILSASLGIISLNTIFAGTCHRASSALFERFGQDIPECAGAYWLGDEDTGIYNNSWKKPLPRSTASGGPWSHQSTWKLKTMPFSGIHAMYSGGGFVLEMPQNADLVGLLNQMKNTDWIDDRTRAIFAEFTLYNPNADLFSVVMIFFELTNIGGVFPNHQIFTAKLYHYSSNLGTYVAICEVLFLVFNIAFTYIEVKRYKKLGRRAYFEDKWSYAEIIQLVLSYTVIGLFFQRLVTTNSIMDQYRASNRQTFVSFYTAIAWDFVLGYTMAFQVAFITLKSVKLLRFNKRMFMISDTITFAKSNLMSFAFMFAIFMIAFGHFTSQAFGSILYGYKNFGTSIFTMLNFALGASDLPGMYEANRILGPIYFAVFVFFSQWCFLTIFVAILNYGISDSKAKAEERRNKFELVDYVIGKVKSIFWVL